MLFDGRSVSFIGENHKNSRPPLPCQDASGFFISDDYSIGVVADGHSSKIRSQIGAQMAAQIALSSLKEISTDYQVITEEFNRSPDEFINRLINSICKRWRDSIFRYDVINPLNDSEYRAAGIDQTSKDVFRRYGTTLVIGVLARDFVFVIQIGDCLAHLIYNDGRIQFLKDLIDSTCNGTNTTSMSDVNAEAEFRYYYSVDEEDFPVAIALSSDGFDAYEGFEIVSDDSDKNEDVAGNGILDIYSYMADSSFWYSQGCISIEERTHQSNKDDVSLAIVFDCESDFISIFNEHFGKRYPSRLEDYATKSDCNYQLSFGGYISDGIVFEYSKKNIRGKDLEGLFSNGEFKCHDENITVASLDPTANYYDCLFNRYFPVPPASSMLSWHVLQLLKMVRDSINVANLDDLFFRTELSMKIIESKLKEYYSNDNDYLSISNLNQWCKSFEIEDVEKDILQGNADGLMDISLIQDGGLWIDRNNNIPKDDRTYGSKEWIIAFVGDYKGKEIIEGTQYYTDGSRYEGKFVKHRPDGGACYSCDSRR